jgi:oligopeptide/dipeptide ABC transporter ATP-binding protein
MEPLLEVRNLRTFFHLEEGLLRAVDDVSFRVGRGETVGLVGESGCGKSVTALSILRLVERPGRIAGGQVLFEGRDLLRLPEPEMRRIRGNRISMIFQEPMTSLNPVFPVGEQIAEAVRLHQGKAKREAMETAIEMLRTVAIPDPERRVHDYPHQLSGGMRQRVMIAMALSCNPALLLADEPSTALDVTIQAQILDLLAGLRERLGLSVVLITHNLGIVAETARRVVVMYTGKVVEEAPVRDLYRDPRHPYTKGLLRSVPKLHKEMRAAGRKRRLDTIEGRVPDILRLPRGCHFAPRCPDAMPRCRENPVPMFRLPEGPLAEEAEPTPAAAAV